MSARVVPRVREQGRDERADFARAAGAALTSVRMSSTTRAAAGTVIGTRGSHSPQRSGSTSARVRAAPRVVGGMALDRWEVSRSKIDGVWDGLDCVYF